MAYKTALLKEFPGTVHEDVQYRGEILDFRPRKIENPGKISWVRVEDETVYLSFDGDFSKGSVVRKVPRYLNGREFESFDENYEPVYKAMHFIHDS